MRKKITVHVNQDLPLDLERRFIIAVIPELAIFMVEWVLPGIGKR